MFLNIWNVPSTYLQVLSNICSYFKLIKQKSNECVVCMKSSVPVLTANHAQVQLELRERGFEVEVGGRTFSTPRQLQNNSNNSPAIY